MCREVCPDNRCLDERTLGAKHPYAMRSSRIYPCGGEIEHLQKVQMRYLEQFGVLEGFNPSEDVESAHGKADSGRRFGTLLRDSVVVPMIVLTSMVIGLVSLLITYKLE